MIEATSCGGVVIFRGKILLLYKNYKNKYEGWVLPKGTVEAGEEYPDTATREVLEETGVKAAIIKYVGKSQYSFTVPEDTVEKDVHWYLMMADSYYSKPQREEYFVDSGYYKYQLLPTCLIIAAFAMPQCRMLLRFAVAHRRRPYALTAYDSRP